MIVISFESPGLSGGLGDRIVGLISCKLIAKLLKKPFYISWTKENVKEYIDYSEYDYELLSSIDATTLSKKYYSYIDNQTGLKHYLMNEAKLFTEDICIFLLNQEISQYLYKNPIYSSNDYCRDILYEYKQLYRDILKPTMGLTQKINSLVTKTENIIGIQIRTGDKNMVTNAGEQHSLFSDNIENELFDILQNIKKHCDNNNTNYKIFLTSDYSNIYNIALKIWSIDNIIYNNDVIQHLDRNAINSDISKVFVDSYILSQHTSSMYISTCSNYGRISALSAVHDNIYDLQRNKLNKKYLISKHEIVL